LQPADAIILPQQKGIAVFLRADLFG